MNASAADAIGLDEIRQVLDARDLLPGGSWGKDSFDAPCPCHDDQRPSLHVEAGKHVAVVLYCHAGCTLENILRALSLWHELKSPSHLFHGATETLRDPKRQGDVGSREGLGPWGEWVLRARALGVRDMQEGVRFSCVLPGHEHMAVCFADGGGPVRNCRSTGPDRSFSFAEVLRWGSGRRGQAVL